MEYPQETRRAADNNVLLVQTVAERMAQSVSQVIIGKRNEVRLAVLGLLFASSGAVLASASGTLG